MLTSQRFLSNNNRDKFCLTCFPDCIAIHCSILFDDVSTFKGLLCAYSYLRILQRPAASNAAFLIRKIKLSITNSKDVLNKITHGETNIVAKYMPGKCEESTVMMCLMINTGCTTPLTSLWLEIEHNLLGCEDSKPCN